MTVHYVFELTPLDPAALQEQVAMALEKRTELISRARYANLWKITDKLRGGEKPLVRRNLRRTKALGFVNLCLGIFLLIPGLTDPKKMWGPLLMGILGIVVGLNGLLRVKKAKPDRFDHAAATLLRGRDRLEPGSCTVTLDNKGLTVSQEGKLTQAAWEDFRCVVETADLLLVCYDNSAVALPKCDLRGSMNALRNTLQKKVRFAQI